MLNVLCFVTTFRISLSDLKGGKLAQLAYPAKAVGLILSDIIGDPIDLVATEFLSALVSWQFLIGLSPLA